MSHGDTYKGSAILTRYCDTILRGLNFPKIDSKIRIEAIVTIFNSEKVLIDATSEYCV